MAMRARGGGGGGAGHGRFTGGVRKVHEDFKPISEWQQDDDSHILIIYLPGFMKEQIKVSTEGHNIVRVRGERLVAGNKWSRFVEDFQVPENCEMTSIRAKFQGGTLNITVPKKPHKEALPPKTSTILDTKKQPTPQKGQEKLSQPTNEKNLEPRKEAAPPKISAIADTKINPAPQKGQEKLLTAVGTSQPTKEKILEPEHVSGGRDEKSSTPLKYVGTAVPQAAARNGIGELKQTHSVPERTDDVLKRTGDKEGENSEKSKELPAKRVKDGIALITNEAKEKNKESKGKETSHSSADYGAFKVGKYKISDLNEERQLLVNMGVAVLVIVALSAYVTYKFASGKDKN
ncbi:hypothetical protein ACJIZ3_018657 [Penstemon smallii]|uniref:SHSP domain-containing protein n=1 Tax=Penstemon smallii TaxID=265156 RepID=A0ABD3SZV1_9LAMI